jgi:Restriction endonuclease
MSTTQRGDTFEQRVFDALTDELKNERLCAAPKHARIHRKKAYHSRDRGSDIITDVSIEVFLPNRSRPSLIWIFECKDYSGSIPIDDVEEFHAKIQQISEDNTKGTIVTSGALQRGARAYAKAKGIGIIRLLPDDQVEVFMEFMTAASAERATQVDWAEFSTALLNPSHRSRRSFFSEADGYLFGSWYSLLFHAFEQITA